MKKRFLSALIVFGILFSPVFAQVDTTYKGVVQVIGYENVYGKMPRMIGWGSASIIDNQGHLLTNNHVVDNGFGGTLDGFAVCVTVDKAQRPKCTYTASLVTRDVEKDIAVLRLDTTDIFGANVSLSQFPALPLAFDYVPNSQDKVVAIGYPRVGADTITETVGVVAGTQEYNDATYIKTDALIAGGNSGGPLTKDGRVIGVNTFGIGGFVDASLGYALQISFAQELINTAKGMTIQSGFDRAIFQNYLNTMYQTNEKGQLVDEIVTINLNGYRITEYDPGRLIVSYQALPDATRIQAFMIERFQTAPINSSAEFAYVLQKNGLYNPSYEKMKPVTIGGIPMFDLFDKTDPSEGLSQGFKKYVAQLSPTDILFFTVQTPTYDESLYAKAKQNLDAFLASVTFQPLNQATAQQKTIVLEEPKVTIQGGETTEKPFTRGGWSEGSLGKMRYSAGVIRTLFETLHEGIQVNVYPQTRDLGRGPNVDELMRVKTQDLTMTQKGKLTVDGHEGFYFCQSKTAGMMTVQGSRVQGDTCSAFIVIDASETQELPYIVEVQMMTEPKNTENNREKFFDYLQNSIQIEPTGEGKTMIASAVVTQALFGDLGTQHPHFSNVVQYLVANKVLIKNRPNFDGDMPMTRGDVVKVYAKGVLAVNMDDAAEQCGYPVKYACLFATQKITIAGESHPMQKLVDDLKIDVNAYASTDKMYYLDTVMKLYLAGVKNVPFSAWGIQKFGEMDNLLYAGAQQQVKDREYAKFGKRRINLSEVTPVADRSSPTYIMRNPKIGLEYDTSATKLLVFDATPSYVSIISPKLMQACKNNIVCYQEETMKQITVLTLGNLVNEINRLIDRAQFMPELEEKKDTEYYGGGYMSY